MALFNLIIRKQAAWRTSLFYPTDCNFEVQESAFRGEKQRLCPEEGAQILTLTLDEPFIAPATVRATKTLSCVENTVSKTIQWWQNPLIFIGFVIFYWYSKVNSLKGRSNVLQPFSQMGREDYFGVIQSPEVPNYEIKKDVHSTRAENNMVYHNVWQRKAADRHISEAIFLIFA